MAGVQKTTGEVVEVADAIIERAIEVSAELVAEEPVVDREAESAHALEKAHEVLSQVDPAYLDKLKGMIAELPQAKFLTEARITKWLGAVMSFEPERVEWHIKRLSGIGGSEIGTLVAPFMDEFSFDTARDIFMNKMMLTVPEPSNGHMRRGTYLEDMIRDEFRKTFNARGVDEDLVKFPTYFNKEHPWLVGNPDDLVEIGGLRFMTDYKCPMPGFKDKYDKNGVSFGYICQLHHYTLIAQAMDIRVDGLLLCSWDMEGWQPDVRQVAMSEEVFETIIRAGDWFWNDCILQNKMPSYSSTPKLKLEDGDHNGVKIKQLLETSAILSTIANRAYAKDKDIKAEIALLMEGRRIGDQKLIHGLMEISAKEVLNEDKALLTLSKLGLDPEDFMTQGSLQPDLLLAKAQAANLDISDCFSKVLNEEAVVAALDKQGVPREKIYDEEASAKLSRSGNPVIKKTAEALKSLSSNLVDAFVARCEGKFIPGQDVEFDAIEEKPRKSPRM